MKEWFRLNRHLLADPHDLWISMKNRFDCCNAAQVESLFLDALVKINYR